MSRIVFYCREEKAHLDIFEYYQQDIEALRALGHDVVVCTRYRDIPLRYDAMFVWWWTYALWPVLMSRLLGRPSLITGVFNFRLPEASGVDFLHRPLWQRALISAATKLASLNLFIDEAELRNCSAHFALSNARQYPCSINADYLKGPGPERRLEVFNLAWSGRRNLDRKGIPELLEALKILKDDGVDVRLTLAGPSGDGSEWLRCRIEELGIADRVTCAGELSRADKIEWLRSFEVYAQPSHHEGFGLATAEAMGGGSCVVTCDVGAVRSVVGDFGIYVSSNSPVELAAGIKRALTDTALRRRLQSAALERARTVFAPEKKRERLKAILTELGIG